MEGGDHGVLAPEHMRKGVAHPMHSVAPPVCAENPRDRVAQAVVGIGDHQFDAVKAALDQEARPERLGVGGSDAEADDLAPTFDGARDAIIAATEKMRPPSRTFR